MPEPGPLVERRDVVRTLLRELVVVAAVVSIAGCVGLAPGRQSGGATPSADATSAVANDGTFEVRISTPSAHVAADGTITIESSLTYVGTDRTATVAGSGTGLVVFGVRQLDGSHVVTPAWTADCAQRTMTAGVAVTQPFAKSGGYSNDDPDAPFMRAYFAERPLRLPPGRWRISATAIVYVGTCSADGSHQVSADVDVDVR
jgi:hypothetical protein